MSQGQSKAPKTWVPRELYQVYVQELLNANPQSVEMVRVKEGQRWVVKEIKTGGYWGKYNTRKRIKNYWIYTNIKGRDGKSRVVEVINYARWKKILDTYFTKAKEYIIQGEVLNLGNRLGTIEASHIERNFANQQVNFAETRKQPQVYDETLKRMKAAKVIYFTDSTYIRIAWRKVGTVANDRMYEFHKAVEFKESFSAANKKDPELKLRYAWYPYIYEPKNKQDGL